MRRLGSVLVSVGAAAAVLMALPGVASAAVSPTPRQFWIPNAGVHALATDGTWLYLGGTFTALHSPSAPSSTFAANHLARVSLATGAPDTGWHPSVTGDVRSLTVSGQSLYLGGSLSAVGGSTRANAAAVSTVTGQVLPWNPGANGPVKRVLTSNGGIVLAGSFTTVAGHSEQHLARVDALTGSLDMTFQAATNNTVNAIAAPAGSSVLVIGGRFTAVDGQPRNYLATISARTGAVQPWVPAIPCTIGTQSNPCQVIDIAATATTYYAAAGGPGGRLSAYSAITAARTFSDTADGDVQAAAVVGNQVVAGGHFAPRFADQTRYMLVAVDDTSGRVDPSFAPKSNNWYPGVVAVLPVAGGVAVAGDLTSISGTSQSYYSVFPTHA